ncbi:unnamed protein product, partial [Linum tenue]
KKSLFPICYLHQYRSKFQSPICSIDRYIPVVVAIAIVNHRCRPLQISIPVVVAIANRRRLLQISIPVVVAIALANRRRLLQISIPVVDIIKRPLHLPVAPPSPTLFVFVALRSALSSPVVDLQFQFSAVLQDIMMCN